MTSRYRIVPFLRDGVETRYHIEEYVRDPEDDDGDYCWDDVGEKSFDSIQQAKNQIDAWIYSEKRKKEWEEKNPTVYYP